MNKLFVVVALFSFYANSSYAATSVCDRSKPMKYALEAYFKKKCSSISSSDLESITSLYVSYDNLEVLPTDFDGLSSSGLALRIETTRDTISPLAFEQLRNHKIFYLHLVAKNINFLEKDTFSNIQADSFWADLGSFETNGSAFTNANLKYVHIRVYNVREPTLVFSSKLFSGSKIDTAVFSLWNRENKTLRISKDAFLAAELNKIEFNMQTWRLTIEQGALPITLKEFNYEGDYLDCPTGCFSPKMLLDQVNINNWGQGIGSKPFAGSSNIKDLVLKLHDSYIDSDFLTDLDVDHFDLDIRSKTFSLHQAKALRKLTLHNAGDMDLVQGQGTINHLEELEILDTLFYDDKDPIHGSLSAFKKLKKLSLGNYSSILYSKVRHGYLTAQDYKKIMSSDSVEQINIGEIQRPKELAGSLENSDFPNLQKLDIAVTAYSEVGDFPILYSQLKKISPPELNLNVYLYDPSLLEEIAKVTQMGWLGGLQKLRTNHLKVKYESDEPRHSANESFVIDEDLINTNKLSIVFSSYHFEDWDLKDATALKEFAELKANKIAKTTGKEVSHSTLWQDKDSEAPKGIIMEFQLK